MNSQKLIEKNSSQKIVFRSIDELGFLEKLQVFVQYNCIDNNAY
ncbi:MAG: hypothetical protein PHX27_01420 [Candidatus ainarchaeum sp.]|nr:hypothetical protein [Candidatus ainarchaeum sp.]